jgi:hypothetical protein
LLLKHLSELLNRVLKCKKSCYFNASLRHLSYFRRYFQNCFNKNTKTFSVCWKSWRWKRTYKIYFGSSTRNLLHVRDCNCLEHHHFCHWSHCCSWECTPKFAEKHIFLNRKIKLCEKLINSNFYMWAKKFFSIWSWNLYFCLRSKNKTDIMKCLNKLVKNC